MLLCQKTITYANFQVAYRKFTSKTEAYIVKRIPQRSFCVMDFKKKILKTFSNVYLGINSQLQFSTEFVM